MGRKTKVNVGDKFINSDNEAYTVTHIDSCKEVYVEFTDGTVLKVTSIHAASGVRNYNSKTVHGVGFTGYGKYSKSTHEKLYFKWSSMLRRGYSEDYKIKKPTYKDVTVCDLWHNFQNFAEWASSRADYIDGWEIDKDILIPNNKVYCPEACCFVPRVINCTIRSSSLKDKTKIPFRISAGRIQYKILVSLDNSNKKTFYFKDIDEAYCTVVKFKTERVTALAEEFKSQLDPAVYLRLKNFKFEDYI